MAAYYNENDPFAAAWLRELIKAGHIADGEVDERSIAVVRPDDLLGFVQCHFFAGIGGWSLALRLAGWPDDRTVWTGSCPCQPFSQSGKTLSADDPRHLWPALFDLIRESRPSEVFGEQVASADGRAWLDLVFTDLEAANYRVGAANLCAAGVGAPHIRQRLYWMGHAIDGESRQEGRVLEGDASGELPDDAQDSGASSIWASSDWIQCDDGRRPIEPGTFPLANGVPERVGLWKGYGNAIVPQVAQVFIEAYLDVE